MAVPLVSMDLFALATVPAGPDEAGEPPPTNFYTLRDNLCSQSSNVGPAAAKPASNLSTSTSYLYSTTDNTNKPNKAVLRSRWQKEIRVVRLYRHQP
jgi:hypothetical protein